MDAPRSTASRNPDGGYGWGLEADLRSPREPARRRPSRLRGARRTSRLPLRLRLPRCATGWNRSRCPTEASRWHCQSRMSAGSAPWWTGGRVRPLRRSRSRWPRGRRSGQRVAAHDPVVAGHAWLERATRYCLAAIAAVEEAPVRLRARVSRSVPRCGAQAPPEAAGLLHASASMSRRTARARVDRGRRARDAPAARHRARPGPAGAHPLFGPSVIAADLDRIAGGQQDDGGWTVDYLKISPAGWGVELCAATSTAHAIDVLRRNGMT